MNYYPNTHITTLKSRLWGKVLETIGEEPMLDLLLNTSIFLQLNQENDVSKSNYYQLAGEFLGRGGERISAFFSPSLFSFFFSFYRFSGCSCSYRGSGLPVIHPGRREINSRFWRDRYPTIWFILPFLASPYPQIACLPINYTLERRNEPSNLVLHTGLYEMNYREVVNN